MHSIISWPYFSLRNLILAPILIAAYFIRFLQFCLIPFHTSFVLSNTPSSDPPTTPPVREADSTPSRIPPKSSKAPPTKRAPPLKTDYPKRLTVDQLEDLLCSPPKLPFCKVEVERSPMKSARQQSWG